MDYDYDSYNENGFHLSPAFFGSPSEEDDYIFKPADFDSDDAIIIYEGSTITNDDPTRPALSSPVETVEGNGYTPPQETWDQSSSSAVTECPIYLSVILIILVATGLVASLLTYTETVIRWKRHTRCHNLLHILVSSACVLLPIPFTITSRFSGKWVFSDAWFKVLAAFASGTQTVCAFQLAYFVLIHCREVINRKEAASSVWNKIICYVLWLIGMAFAWPCAVYDSILSDVIKGQRVSQGRSFGASLYIKINIAVSYIFPPLVTILSLITALQHKPNAKDAKHWEIPLEIQRRLKEAAIISILYFVCWLPYRVWRITTLPQLIVQGCGVPSDVFLLIGIAYCTLMPLLHYGLSFNLRKPEKVIEVSLMGEGSAETNGGCDNGENDSKDDSV